MFLAVELLDTDKNTIHDAQMPLRWIVATVNTVSHCMSIFGIVILTLWRVCVPKWTLRQRVRMPISWKGPNHCFPIVYFGSTRLMDRISVDLLMILFPLV